MGNVLLDLLFPARCVGCGKWGRYICQKCQKSLTFRTQWCPVCAKPAIDGLTHPKCFKKYSLDGLIIVFEYKGILRQVIKDIKYRFVFDMVSEVIGYIPSSLLSTPHLKSTPISIYPIPLSTSRRRWRGFNQAEKITQVLAVKINKPVAADLLMRKFQSKTQAEISHKEDRIKNAQGIFALKTTTLPKNILLVDDVYTTGATLTEATKVLKHGGVEKVYGFTLAR